MKLTVAALLIASSFSIAAAPPAPQAIFDAIHADDRAALKKLVTDKASAGVKDSRETTALMYACAFGSLDAVKLLLHKGADVNAANGIGATALMWSTSEPEKVKMLLAHGADVNAKSKAGRTALMIAASQPGSDATVNMLLAKGADIGVTDKGGMNFLLAASAWGNSKQVATALARGANPNVADESGSTPLMNAAAEGDLESVKLLMAKGADVNAVSHDQSAAVMNGPIALGRFTALTLAASYGPSAVVSELLKGGAKPDVHDIRGMSPLLLASATEHRDPETIRLLRAAGAEDSADVRTWTAKFETQNAAAPGESYPDTVDRALTLLRSTSAGFMKTGGCIACHAQPAAAMATRVALDHGHRVDNAFAQDLPLAKGRWTSLRDGLLLRQDTPGGADEIDYSLLFYMTPMGYKPDSVTASMVVNLLSQQMPNGSWHNGGIARAPMEDSDISRTAMSLRAIQLFSWPGRKADIDARIERAKLFLRGAQPIYNEDFAMRALGLHWAGDAAAAEASAKLAALQNADGGWSQNKRLESDAYATGQTLYALHESGMATSDPVYKRGVAFLRATQQADGSWHVRSRSPKFQPYFESGFPYGHDQWISTMGTAWAAIACAM